MCSSTIILAISTLICILSKHIVTAAGKQCPDIATVRDNKDDTVDAKIIYFEGSGQQIAHISCEGETSGVVELVSNDNSLGLIENDTHKAICRLGRWYTLNKYGRIAVIKEIACYVHH
ncbi:Protein CBG22762 [Caenorhabditis briggsae]|uniref:Uncharacterized protein n=2 Tax=Caenorhabditis briggsae TaxID=6238 RepID=A0AAE8ZVU9_CAEBR|nr:Protein CBG22762 [Caenorhabditis briggsae]ULT84047.1 hypothetical protein L3Y34_012993 [Caenorhabditis briggsae]UMM43291.1 hypothetical protein L5515_018843 [Caenorhabditis briggsae]CAP39279.1 Protein CBG22762 [Caenorhabditis briggsae]